MKKILGLTFLLAGFALFAQQTHTVQPKETIYGISKKYGISQDELSKANPNITARGIQPGDVLNIPTKGAVKNPESEPKITTSTALEQPTLPKDDANYTYIQIQPKETIYSLTRKYDISEATLTSLNPKIKQGLKSGDIIRLPKPKNNADKTNMVVPDGMHLVEKGQTLYSISQQYNLKVEDFYASNPDLQTSDLKEGMFLTVPKKSATNVVIKDNFIEHKVKSGETVYGLTSQYQVTMAEIINANPELVTTGLKDGATVLIPLQEGAKITTYTSPKSIKRVNDDQINVVLFFPFDLGKSTNMKTNTAMQFFTGSKVALDQLAKQGKNINVKVIDSEKDMSKLLTLSTEYDLNKADAIIGPFFASSVEQIAVMLENSNIPIVSPFANATSLDNFSNVIMASPREEVMADQIIDELNKNYNKEQIYILTDDKHSDLASYTKTELEKKLKANVTIVTDANQIVQPSETVGADKYVTPIVTILVSDNDKLGVDYLNKIKTFDYDNLKAFGVKAPAIYDIFNTRNKANIDKLKEIGFVYSTTRLLNIYGENEQNILKAFKDAYCEDPNSVEQLGYDVTYDILSRMNAKGDFTNNLSAENTQLSSRFSYKRIGNNKAYANDAVRIVRLKN